ncbi:MAG: hypothetical protein HN380_33475, partial [Victivallales bacterium]|nr:hypothetical protein [Victivallales bacterium]
MTVSRRKLPSGKRVKFYNYRFTHDGKLYTGSTGCTTKRDALAFERNIIEPLKQQKSAKQVTEN